MQRFKNILCVVPPEPDDQLILRRAIALAEANQAHLTVLRIIDELPETTLLSQLLPVKNIQSKIIEEHHQALEKLLAPWRNNCTVRTVIRTGIPFLETIREILHRGHDLVIKTAESAHPLGRLFGSDDMHLLRKCPCPVWLVRPQSPKTYRCILAAVDVNDHYPQNERETRHLLNVQIMEMASSLALSEFAELHIVHAWDALGETVMRHAMVEASEKAISAYIQEVKQQHQHNLNELLDGTLHRLGEEALAYLTPKVHLVRGTAHKEIPAIADQINADLVVMGTVARTGIPGLFMGNTAETILNRIDSSVIAIKPPGFVTPVKPEHP